MSDLQELALADVLPHLATDEAVKLGHELQLPPWLVLRSGDRDDPDGAAASVPPPSCRGRNWTAADTAYVRKYVGLLEASEIAATLNRTETAIRVKAKREGLHLRRRRRAYHIYTAQDLGRIFGVDAKSVAAWIERGWLVAVRSSNAQGCPHRITRGDVYRFLNSPPAAYTVHPARIRDTRLKRGWERAGHAAYLPIGAAADYLGIRTSRLSRLARQGRVPAIRWGNWFIRQDDLDQLRVVLDNPPPKKWTPGRSYTEADDRHLVAGSAIGFNSADLSAMTSWSKGAITSHLRSLALAGQLAVLDQDMPFLWRLRPGKEPGLLADPGWFPEFSDVALALQSYAAGSADLDTRQWELLGVVARNWLFFWLHNALPRHGQGSEVEDQIRLVSHRLRYRIPRVSTLQAEVERAFSLLPSIGLDPVRGCWNVQWEIARQTLALPCSPHQLQDDRFADMPQVSFSDALAAGSPGSAGPCRAVIGS